MSQSKVYAYLLISFVVLSVIGCSSLHSQAKIPETKLSKQNEEKPEPEPESASINWIDAFTLSASQRNDSLQSLFTPNTMKDILLRSIFLTHESASDEELQEAEQLLKSNYISDSSIDENDAYKVRSYILKLNDIFQAHKLEVLALKKQINTYKLLIKKQKQENNVLENKIEALTDIEHQINLRPDKNLLQVSP